MGVLAAQCLYGEMSTVTRHKLDESRSSFASVLLVDGERPIRPAHWPSSCLMVNRRPIDRTAFDSLECVVEFRRTMCNSYWMIEQVRVLLSSRAQTHRSTRHAF
jgi:hypothetical protein